MSERPWSVINDMGKIEAFVTDATKEKALSKEAIENILSVMLDHWPYHLRSLVKLRAKSEAIESGKKVPPRAGDGSDGSSASVGDPFRR